MFTRVNDLKQHVKSRHQTIYGGLSSTFFTVATGFYLGVHAADYRKIVQVAPYESEDSFEARKAVLRWCASQLNAGKITQEWRREWLLAKVAEKPIGADVSQTSQKRPAARTEEEDIGKDPDVYLDDIIVIKKTKPLDYSTEEEIASSASSHAESDKEEESMREFEATKLVDTPATATSATSNTTSDQGPVTLATSTEFDSSIVNEKGDGSQVEHGGDVNVSNIETKELIETSKPQQTGSKEETSSTVSKKEISTVQERAKNLLRYGLMPLFAPSRRDWTKGGLLQLDEDSRGFTWPPYKWQQMEPDQKLLSVEFAANFIEFKLTGAFPLLSRSTLLDKYNFLVLPGTAKIRRTEQEKVHAKSRYYAYQELRRIALSDSVSKEDCDYIDFYERARKGGVTDPLVDAIEQLKIPLRLSD